MTLAISCQERPKTPNDLTLFNQTFQKKENYQTQWLQWFLARKDPKYQMTWRFSIKLARMKKITELPNDFKDFFHRMTQNTKWPPAFNSNLPKWPKLPYERKDPKHQMTWHFSIKLARMKKIAKLLNDFYNFILGMTLNTKWPPVCNSNLPQWRKLPHDIREWPNNQITSLFI